MNSPVVLGKFSGWECLFWIAAAVPIAIWLNESIALLVFISVYAIIRTSFADWQSYRAEARALAQQDELVEKIDEITPDPDPK